MEQSYTPNEKVLAKYAELIVHFGLLSKDRKPLKKGGVVRFVVPEVAKPLYFHLQTAILKAGYHPLGVFMPSNDTQYNFDKNFFDHASKDQIEFLDDKIQRSTFEQIDAVIRIIADTHPHALNEVDSKKVMRRSHALKLIKELTLKKSDAGDLKWTIALYGTDQEAAEAGMSGKQFWQQIINACYLNEANPVKIWKQLDKTIDTTAKKLTRMNIKSLHVVGPDMDIHIGVGKNRKWLAGGGFNIPSYEVFTSPDRNDINGWARFNQPHYRYGRKIEGAELWFKNGKVVKSKAVKNHDLLKNMLKTPGGDYIGEFSLTDARISRITKFMANTLYDENVGGKYGNTHMAIGSAYRMCYNGDGSKLKEKDWEKLGYNQSVVHSDLVSTTKRTVTATLQNGSKKVIYKDGKFVI